MRIYVAGSYNADNITTSLDNMRIGMRASVKVLLAGHTPFCPWFDYHFQLMLRGTEQLTINDYYRYSMDWLEVSDAVYVCNFKPDSNGTKAEIERAEELNIPVFFEFGELIRFINGRKGFNPDS